MSNLTGTVDAEFSLSSLLEFSANNDIEGFEKSLTHFSLVNEVGTWYGRHRTSKKMVCEDLTPLMIAARYGSVDIVKLIVSLSEVDVNFFYGLDKSTALHCAACGGSTNAVEVVKLLLLAGADPNATDVNGHRPFDVIVAPLSRSDLKVFLEELLKDNYAVCQCDIHVTSVSFASPSSSPERRSLSSVSDSMFSPVTCEPNDITVTSVAQKKEYPFDTSLPDIKNSMYATDEFRMYLFKIRPCSRAYSHDWTECPFVHPGENARRRDPRKYHYSCVPCPDFRKGTCRYVDLCEYAHGVFECWLHPAQYRTRLCKDGVSCSRRVCFFAHAAEELRPLYMSTGSAVPSSQALASAGVMDMAVELGILPGSPSSVSSVSPSGNGTAHSSIVWSQPNVPTLHFSGRNFQSSRLRSSLGARGTPAEDFNMLQGFEMQQQHLLNDMPGLSQQHLGTSSPNFSVQPKTFLPSILPVLFSNEISSRYSNQLATSSLFSPTHKSAFLNQQQKQSMLCPIKTNMYSLNNIDNLFLEGSFSASSPGRMSPRSNETLSPINSRLSAASHHEKQQQELRNVTSRDLGSNLTRDFGSSGPGFIGSPVNTWSQWGSPNGKVDWSVQAGELDCLRRSCSIGHNGEEHDVSWVQSLVKESPHESKETPSEVFNSKPQSDSIHTALGAWAEQLQFDQATNGRK